MASSSEEELLRVLHGRKEMGLELSRQSAPPVRMYSPAHWLLERLLYEQEAQQDGTRQGEGGGRSGQEQLKPSREKAYRLFLWAMEQKPALKTDRSVYDWLSEHPDVPEELPNFAAWSRYLSEARAYHNDRKHTPRTTKSASGKSVVRRDQI